MQEHHRLPKAVSTTPRRGGSTPSGTPSAGRVRVPVETVVPSSPWHQKSISVTHWIRVTFLPLIGSILWEGTLGVVHCIHWILRFLVMVVMMRVMRTVKLLFILALRGTIPPFEASNTFRSSTPSSNPTPVASPVSSSISSSGRMAPSPTKCTLLAQELLKKKKHNRLPGGTKTPLRNRPLSPPTSSSVTPSRREKVDSGVTVPGVVRDGTPPLSEMAMEEAAAAPISSPRVAADERKRNRRFQVVPFMGTTTSTRLWRPKWNHPPPQRIGGNDPEILRGPPLIRRVRSSRLLGHRASSSSTVGSSSSVSSSTSTLSRRMSVPRLRQRRMSSSCQTLLEQVHDEPARRPVPDSSTPAVWWNKRFTTGTMPPTSSMSSFLNNNNRKEDESVSISPSPACIMELVFFDRHEETKEDVTTSSQKTPLGKSTTPTRS